jgi:anti-sigma factor RsiW
MNSSDWEERVALHAGGDLPPAEAAEVERHLRECAACQVFASGLKQSLALLKEAHHEPLAPAHFSAVRARVVAELEQERRRGALWARRLAWSFGLAAAVAALLVMLALRPGRTPERRAPVVAANHPPVVVARVSAAPPPARHRVAWRVARPIVPDTPAPEPLIVKLQTDDPNVVIYWIADRKRGE